MAHKIVAIILERPGPGVSTSNTTRIQTCVSGVEVGQKGWINNGGGNCGYRWERVETKTALKTYTPTDNPL